MMLHQSTSSRREFLSRSTSTVAAATWTPALLTRVGNASETKRDNRLRMGLIGVGSMGKQEGQQFDEMCDILAVCDVDSRHMEECHVHPKIGAKSKDGKKFPLGQHKDYRAILDRKDIDVVSIVTPDHWHVKIAIEALLAGKHVFCQKPLTLTIEEGQLIREAAEKSDRVFQVGTQQRSLPSCLTAVLMVRKGMLGDIRRVTCDVGGSPTSTPIPTADVPSTLDFHQWLGQAPLVEYRATKETYTEFHKYTWPKHSRTHYEFRWWYEYSGGKFTDWGAHHIDIALWALNQNGPGQGPTTFNPLLAEHPVPFKDGYPTIADRYNTSTKFSIDCGFSHGVTMNVCSHSPDGNGILFEGTKGRIHMNRGRIKGKPYEIDQLHRSLTETDYRKLFNDMPVERGWMGHKQNFLNCIETGGQPVSDVASHVQAMNVCHLCAISARLGRELKWNPSSERFEGDELAQSFVARKRRKGFEIPKV